jgi:hypothetical protein
LYILLPLPIVATARSAFANIRNHTRLPGNFQPLAVRVISALGTLVYNAQSKPSEWPHPNETEPA